MIQALWSFKGLFLIIRTYFMPKTFLVIIPAYNAASTLPSLIDKIHEQPVASQCDILVVDDGSDDGTAEIAKQGIGRVIFHPTNLGKGEALKTGFQYAIQNNYSAVITMDADLQHEHPGMEGDGRRRRRLSGRLHHPGHGRQ